MKLLVFPTDNSVTVIAIKGASKRSVATGKSNRKEPVSTDLLQSIADGADLSNELDHLFVVLCRVSLRCDGVSRIKRNQVSFHNAYVTIKVDKSKS